MSVEVKKEVVEAVKENVASVAAEQAAVVENNVMNLFRLPNL